MILNNHNILIQNNCYYRPSKNVQIICSNKTMQLMKIEVEIVPPNELLN